MLSIVIFSGQSSPLVIEVEDAALDIRDFVVQRMLRDLIGMVCHAVVVGIEQFRRGNEVGYVVKVIDENAKVNYFSQSDN